MIARHPEAVVEALASWGVETQDPKSGRGASHLVVSLYRKEPSHLLCGNLLSAIASWDGAPQCLMGRATRQPVLGLFDRPDWRILRVRRFILLIHKTCSLNGLHFISSGVAYYYPAGSCE